MALPFFQVRSAIVQALRANSAVQASLTGAVAPLWNVLDHVPVTQVFPYVYAGDIQGQMGKAFSMGPQGKATSLLITLHIFSQYNGKKEMEGIASAIDDVLDEKKLTLTDGFTWFSCLFNNFIPLVEDDQGANDETQHGALRYRIETQG